MRRHGTRQETPLRSTSTVSTSDLQTPLMSNIFTNDNTYAVDSHDFSSHRSNLTDLGPSASNPPTNTDAVGENEEESVPTNAKASYHSVGVDEPVLGQIDTNQGANGVSPGGLRTGGTGASYLTAPSHNPSIVSDFPLHPRASTQETRGCRTSLTSVGAWVGSISFRGSYNEMRFVDLLVGSSIGASVGSSVESSLGSLWARLRGCRWVHWWERLSCCG